ncbi:hypothetical protein C8R44DRAFT_889780 [Mycena epipterygia]|nr:hypothetical protein C8R44DRAFT_889780 [Mycena epipterygia]
MPNKQAVTVSRIPLSSPILAAPLPPFIAHARPTNCLPTPAHLWRCLRPADEELGQAPRAPKFGYLPCRPAVLVRARVEDGVKSANEALVCRPEMPQLGGSPERSEGGASNGRSPSRTRRN